MDRHGIAFDRLVYVGDGIWDVRAARRLGIGFVGIGEGDREIQLREEGAEIVLPDYEDRDAFVQAILSQARGPLDPPV